MLTEYLLECEVGFWIKVSHERKRIDGLATVKCLYVANLQIIIEESTPVKLIIVKRSDSVVWE